MGEKSQPCHFRVIFALYNYAERALLLEQVVRVFSFLFFFKAKIIFICSEVVPLPPHKLFFFFSFSVVSSISKHSGGLRRSNWRGCVRDSGLDYLEMWGGGFA